MNNKKRLLMIFCVLILLTTAGGMLVGCNESANVPSTSANDKNKAAIDNQTDSIHSKEENIEAYLQSKGYKMQMNSGMGFDIYVPSIDREKNQAFFNSLNNKSMPNGYDFSSYLDKPLQYVAAAIEDNGIYKDINFLCCQEQIVGVWVDVSNKEHLDTRQKLIPFNFVYDTPEKLLKYQSKYVGDNSNITNLVYTLPYINGVKPLGIELKTDNKPYGIIVNCHGYGVDNKSSLPYFKNAAVIFSLIDNVEVITFNITDMDNNKSFDFTRAEIEDYFQQDVRQYTKSNKEYKKFLKAVLDVNLN